MRRKRSLLVFSLSAILAVSTVQASFSEGVYAATNITNDITKMVGELPAGTQGTLTDTVNFRQGPGTNNPVITTLQVGLTVELLSRNEQNWYQIRTGGQTGWVSGEYIVPKSADAPNVTRINQYPSSPNFYEVQGDKLYHVLGSPEYRSASFLVGPAPANFKAGEVYVRDENYQFYRRAAEGDFLIGTFSPPYVFLDLRLPTRMQAADIDNFIRANSPTSPLVGKGQAFLNAQQKFGVNAQYLAAHAILESAWGLSQIARDKNNLYGYQAYDSDPYSNAASFATLDDSINFVAYYVATAYLNPSGSWYGGSSNLKGMNKHYATDPYWSEKIGGIMARMRDYNQADYNGANIMSVTAPKPAGPIVVPVTADLTETYPAGTTAVVTEENLNFRSLPTTASDKLGTLPKGTHLAVEGRGTGNWYRVKNGDQTGWVYGDYIKITYGEGSISGRNGQPGTTPVTETPKISFSDVPAGHWSKSYIDNLVGKKIISGYQDGTFKPTQEISREQSAILLAKALQLNMENRPTPKASDVNDDNPYYKAIAAVMDEKLFVGDGGKFNPGKTLTRAEMAAILVKAFKLQGTSSSQFKDINGHWGANAIQILAANKITSGYPDGTFKPNQPVSREEFATFLAKVMK